MKKDIFYSLTSIKHNIEIGNQTERKLRFLSHLFFSFIMIVIIIFLCYHNYYSYQIVYLHYDNYYFCFHLHPFVECPNITFKNSSYIISVYGWSWHWNRDNCQRRGGDLVSIETEEEWNFINNEIQMRNTSNYDNRWSIGLRKEAGNWTWVSGRPLTICKWGEGERKGEHDAAFMYKLNSNDERGVFGSVNRWGQGDPHAYICEISEGKSFFVLLCFLNFCYYYCYYYYYYYYYYYHYFYYYFKRT